MKNKYLLTLLGLTVALVLGLIIYQFKPTEQPPSLQDIEALKKQKMAERIALNQQRNAPTKSTTPNDVGIEVHKLKNRQHITSLYDRARDPKMIAATEKKYKHFLKTGMMMEGSARENYFSEKLIEFLAKEHVSKQEAITVLGFEPRAYQSDLINRDYDLKINTIMGVNNTANYAIYQKQNGEYLAIDQMNINDPNAPTYVSESLMKEFVNVLLGPEQNIGGVYQYYPDDKTHILSFIHQNESFSLYATDISKAELFNVANDLLRLVEKR